VEKEKYSSHLAKFKVLHQKQNEEIKLFADGYIGSALGTGNEQQYNGTLIITDRRVAFFHIGEFGDIFKTVPLNTITDIKRKSFLGHRTIQISTANNSLTFKTFSKDCAMSIYTWLQGQLFSPVSNAAR